MYKFKFVDIGEGIHEGTIAELLKNPGDDVKEGENVFLVETDKVTAEIPSPVSGKFHKWNFKVGDTIHVGDIVFEVDDGSNSSEKLSESENITKPTRNVKEIEDTENASVVGELEVSNEILGSYDQEETVVKESKKILATPVARKLATKKNIDLNSIIGTGPHGRILKKDILNSESKTSENQSNNSFINAYAKSASTNEVEKIKLSGMRKAISNAMVRSVSTIPHTTLMDDVDVTAMWIMRQEVNTTIAKDKTIEIDKISFMPFIIKAVSKAIEKFPIVNSSLNEKNDEIIIKKYINMGIAVDAPNGLIVPVINNTNFLSLSELGIELSQLANKIKNNKIGPKDMQNGTFTISNYGSIGASYGTPIINYPEAGIIGVGKIVKIPMLNDENDIVVGYSLPISFSFDHRIFDGADAGRFMNEVKKYLANPSLMLI